MGVVADVCQSFCLDSGAFSAWTRNIEMNWNQYRQWVSEWYRHPGFDFALITDVIDGGEKANDDHINRWCDDGLRDFGVPVWHMDESIDRFERLCNSWTRVAIGSSGQWRTPNTSSWWDRISEAMGAICGEDGRPPCRLHGLRMLNPEIFVRLPLASADSTNATVNSGSSSRFGMYKPPTAGQRAEVIASIVERQNSAPIWIKECVQYSLHLT